MEFFNCMFVSTVICDSESWKTMGKKKTKLTKIKCMRYVRGCTKAVEIRYGTIRSGLNVFWIND